MPENIRCCPRCNGTGEIRTGWFVQHRYQDGSDLFGPYASEEEARREHPEDKFGSNYGVYVDYVEREL